MIERDICKRTRTFALRIIKLYQFLETRKGAARILGGQLLKAGTSIGANVAEAQAGQTKADFIAKYSIAHKEAREAYYWLVLIRDSGLVPQSRLVSLLSECEELLKILTAILLKAKNRKSEKEKER